MGIPHVTSFCWCMGLEMGSKVIGFAHLLVSMCLMVACSLFAVKAREYIGTVEDAGDRLYSTWYAVAVAVAVVSVVHVLLAVTLIVSVYKRFVLGVRAWSLVMSLLWAAALALDLLALLLYGVSGSGSDIFLSFLEGLIFFGMVAYCIITVNSFYLLLRSCEDMEGPHKTYY